LRKTTLFVFFLFIISNIFSNDRTLYVDNFSNIIGSPNKEDKLLLFAMRNDFKTLILYDLNKVDKMWSLSDPRKNNVLAEFILKAKTEFKIKNIGASGESASFFTNTINLYNNSRSAPNEKFDIYNLEYEYWSNKASGENGYYCENYLKANSSPCNREGSFNFFIENLKELKTLSKNNIHSIKIDAYVGYYSQEEIKLIAKYSDRLIVQAYGRNPQTSFKFAKKNLEHVLKNNSKIKTSIVFSTRMDKMGYFFKFNDLEKSESLFFDVMNDHNINLKKDLNLGGFSYHTFSFLEKSVSYYSYRQN
jgi:hypothetical protein